MNRTRISHTSQIPWHKQFWPWFLIALPGTVVIAALWTLVIANRYADDLVVDEYYREGLAINRQLERRKQAQQLGLRAELSLEGRHLTVNVEGDIDAQQLRLRLAHPMEAERDLVLPLQRLDSGRYTVQLPLAVEGHWLWQLDSGDGSPWRLDGAADF